MQTPRGLPMNQKCKIEDVQKAYFRHRHAQLFELRNSAGVVWQVWGKSWGPCTFLFSSSCGNAHSAAPCSTVPEQRGKACCIFPLGRNTCWTLWRQIARRLTGHKPSFRSLTPAKALAFLHSIPARHNSRFARVPVPPPVRQRTSSSHRKCPFAPPLQREYLRTAYSGPGHSVGPR